MKKVKTVPIHARLTEADLAAVDAAAIEQKPFPVSRSTMLAIIVREWAERRESPKRKASR